MAARRGKPTKDELSVLLGGCRMSAFGKTKHPKKVGMYDLPAGHAELLQRHLDLGNGMFFGRDADHESV